MSPNLKIIMTSIMSEDKHDTEIISATMRTEEPAVKMMADFIFILMFPSLWWGEGRRRMMVQVPRRPEYQCRSAGCH